MQVKTLKLLWQCLTVELRENYMWKSKLIVLLFRCANYLANKPKCTWIITFPFFIFYILIVEWLLGIEIPIKTAIGKGLKIYHGVGLVINGYSKIGENFTVRHCVTIGNKVLNDGSLSNSPVIGNNVELGASACIIGGITIGDNVKVGAGTVINKNIADNITVVGKGFREI